MTLCRTLTAYRVLWPGRGKDLYSVPMSRFFYYRLFLRAEAVSGGFGFCPRSRRKRMLMGIFWVTEICAFQREISWQELSTLVGVQISQGHSRSSELEMRGHARKRSIIDSSGQTVTLQVEETTHDMITCKDDLKDALH